MSKYYKCECNKIVLHSRARQHKCVPILRGIDEEQARIKWLNSQRQKAVAKIRQLQKDA